MRRTLLIGLVVALVGAVTATAVAKSDRGADKQPVVRIFEDGVATDGTEEVGTAKLIRRDDSLEATAKVSGLTPGGVYTFWWVVIPAGGSFPDNAFVAGAGGHVVGKNGKATQRMTAELGQSSIEGFLIPFQDLDFDLATAEVHVEIAYHGQKADQGEYLDAALSDFWTGTACPDNGNNPIGFPGDTAPVFSNPDQPHCPVSMVAIYPSS